MTLPESPFSGVPTPIVELCNGLVDFVERAVGIRPDYAMDTLSIVDHYAVQARSEVSQRPELVDLTAQGLGAYFGEVARRNLGAFWKVPSPNFHDWQICGETAYVAINPIGVGYDALFGSTEHSGPSSQLKLAPEDQEPVKQRLDALPPVRPEEYATLCTRLETLEIVMDCVRGEAGRRGYEDVTYSPHDYGAAPLRLQDF